MKKYVKFIICIIIAIAIVYVSDYIGIFKTPNIVTVEIPSGSNVYEISELLKDNKIIRHPYVFTLYSIIRNSEFQSGVHQIDQKSYRKIFEELSSYTSAEVKSVTITEGMEQREIAVLLEKNGICSANEFNNAAKVENFEDYWFLKDIPVRKYELEGYLFPDTYEFATGDSAENIIRKMLDNFDSKISTDMKNKISDSQLNFDQLITLASIVEREAATNADYKLVSGIFYNRLNSVGEGIGYLESCATVQYILAERKPVLSIDDTKIDSPYNTYIYSGLPVGPISSPGIKTIEAAISPEKTEYLYFASDSSGKIYYAKTFSEHQNNMRKAGL